jgi:flagellar protein FlaG
MPTEITTEMRQSMSRVAETSRVQQEQKVIGADRIDARQSLSANEQTVPLAKESSQPSNEQLDQATADMNKRVQSLKRDLRFSVNEDTGETVIRVIDSATQDLIRTIPSDEFLSVSQQLNQSVGLLLNAKA